MSAKLVWVQDDGTLTCGHDHRNGRAGPIDGEWYCEQCMWGFEAALDQAIAAAEEAATCTPKSMQRE